MALRIQLFVVFIHLLLGVIAPAVYLMIPDPGSKSKKNKNPVISWMLLSWGVFFTGWSIYILTNYVFGQSILAGVVATLIGVIPFMVLAGVAFWQATIRWRQPKLG